MSQSAIYVVNNFNQLVAEDGIINLGTVVRRFGPNLKLSGNAIQIAGAGYYELNASITAAPTAVGEVTVTAYKDGVIIPGATATETVAASGDYVNLSLSALVREPCCCCESLSNLTFIISGIESNITNIAVDVVKL